MLFTQKWNYKYNKDEIVVTNTFDGCELLINGQVQDKKKGLSIGDELYGKLATGELIRVSLVTGILKVKCTLHVNDILQKPVSEE